MINFGSEIKTSKINQCEFIDYDPALRKKGPKAFVLSIFEIEEGHEVPKDKPTLVKLLKQGIVIPFHKNFCSSCHKVPKVRNSIFDLRF